MKNLIIISAIIFVVLIVIYAYIVNNLKNKIDANITDINFKTGTSGAIANIKVEITNESVLKEINIRDLTVSLYANSSDSKIGTMTKPGKIKIGRKTDIAFTLTDLNILLITDAMATLSDGWTANVSFKKYGQKISFTHQIKEIN